MDPNAKKIADREKFIWSKEKKFRTNLSLKLVTRRVTLHYEEKWQETFLSELLRESKGEKQSDVKSNFRAKIK